MTQGHSLLLCRQNYIIYIILTFLPSYVIINITTGVVIIFERRNFIMKFRRLSGQELKKVKKAVDLIGGTLTGHSFVDGTYYVGVSPDTQATPRFRRALESALGTQNIVLNGRVI